MPYTTWDIVPKTLLQITFDGFILVAKVKYSISKYRRKNFWKNRLQSYRSKVWNVFLWIFFVGENGYAFFPYGRKVTSSPWNWYYSPKISFKIRAFFRTIMLTRSNGQGEADDFILKIILVISLYVGAWRWKPIEGISSFRIHEGVLYSVDRFFSDRFFWK